MKFDVPLRRVHEITNIRRQFIKTYFKSVSKIRGKHHTRAKQKVIKFKSVAKIQMYTNLIQTNVHCFMLFNTTFY
jgi:hypothetical protein